MSHAIRIVGIDPGLRRTGWGVIEAEGNRLIYVACGSVEPPDDLPLASRLLAIHEGLGVLNGIERELAGSLGVERMDDLRETLAALSDLLDPPDLSPFGTTPR